MSNRHIHVIVPDDLYERYQQVRWGLRGHLVSQALDLIFEYIDKEGMDLEELLKLIAERKARIIYDGPA